MTDPDIQRLRAKYQEDRATSRHVGTSRARTGRVDTATGDLLDDPRVYDPSGTLIPNKIWVRIYPTQQNAVGRGQTPVWNTSPRVNDLIADAAVRVGYNADGELAIIGADDAALDLWAGAAAPAVFGGPNVPGELNSVLIPLANIIDLKPYTEDGVYLRAFPGWLPNGTRWDDDAVDGAVDIISEVTATASRIAYVVAGIDLDTNEWLTATTEDRPLTFNPPPYSDIETVLQTDAWANAFQIAAIPLSNGAASFSNSDIVDIRSLGGRGSGAAAPGEPLLDDDGNLMLDDDGSIMYADAG